MTIIRRALAPTTSSVGAQPVDADLTAIAALDSTTAGVLSTDGSGWFRKTYAQLKTALSLTKSDVGLGNVTNDAQVTGVTAADATVTIGGTSAAPTVAVGTIAESQVTNLAADLAAKVVKLTLTAVKTSSYTAAANEFVPVDTTSGNVTVTFPTAPADGTRVGVKHVVRGSTNTVTVALAGADVFNVAGGATTGTITLLNQATIFQYRASGAIWYATGDDMPLSQLDLRFQPLDSDLTAIAGLTATTDNIVQSVGGAWASRTPAQVKTALGLVVPDVQTFTSSGTWTKPAGVTTVHVAMVGGGGGGGSGRRGASGTAWGAGGGGGGGGYAANTFPASLLGATESVTVGTGGAGGAAVTANDTSGAGGVTGVASAFGTSPRIRATGGSLGGAGTGSAGSGGGSGSGLSAGGSGGAGGLGAAGVVASTIGGPGGPGGGGGGGISTTPAAFAGAAGQVSQQTSTLTVGTAGAIDGNGGAGSSITAGLPLPGASAGGGGASITGAGGTGGAGGSYGAGGGGGGASLNGSNSGAGGAGAPGIVVVTSW